MIHVDLRQFFTTPLPVKESRESFIEKRKVDTPQDGDGTPDGPASPDSGSDQ